jgi:DNA polymerase-1
MLSKRETGSFSGRFDNGGSQLRNEIFPEYKAHRDATPKRYCCSLYTSITEGDIPIIEVKGFEADDLIGTIAKQAEKKTTKSLW